MPVALHFLFGLATLTFSIFELLARHFHLNLVVFNLPLFARSIFGPVPSNFRFKLAIVAPISHDFLR